jgi:hypothetical protein
MRQEGRRNDGAQEMVQPEAKQASQEHPGAPETLPATGSLSVPGGEKKMMEREIKRTQEATKFVAMLVEMKTFAVSSLRRRMSVLWEEERERTGGKIRVPTRSSLDIDEMYDPEFCKAGKDELPPHAHPFNVPAMDGFHVETCDECGAASEGFSGRPKQCTGWRSWRSSARHRLRRPRPIGRGPRTSSL